VVYAGDRYRSHCWWIRCWMPWYTLWILVFAF
jgi:hypothetical protein